MFRKTRKSLPEPEPESPVEFHPRSNGEFIPWDPNPREVAADRLFHRLAAEKAAYTGMSRRKFIESSCGLATALMALNQVMGCGGEGGVYKVDEDSTLDPRAADAVVGGAGEFIFDGQTHHNDSATMEDYIRQVFINSDTAVACISVGPQPPSQEGTCHRVATRELVNRLSEGRRVVLQAKVWPHLGQAQLDGMPALAGNFRINAWKSYPHEGNWEFDDPRIGIPFIERGRQLGIKVFAAHKGLGPSSPRDLGVVAAAYPDTAFIAFHSGYESDFTEGPYRPEVNRGVDRLIKTYLDNRVAEKGGKLYADLGSIWNTLSVGAGRGLQGAAHVLGKLLKHLGPDRICWGTDSIYTGSPRAQIAAFRAFQIPAQLQEQFGYPALTDEAKAKILGLNNAAIYGVDPGAVLKAVTGDSLERAKVLMKSGEIPYQNCSLGPRTRREFFAMLRAGDPGIHTYGVNVS